MVDLVSESEHSVHAATSEVVAVGVAVSADRVSNMWKVDAVAGVEVATMGESVPASPNQGWKTLFLGLPLPFHAPVEDNALLDNFLGKSPPLSVFQRTVNKLWGREGSIELRFLAPTVYLIKFSSQRVRDWVLESDPWHVQQKALIFRRWLPGMLPEVVTLDKAPIWVKLWHVPLELYSQQGLGYLASALGKPLYTDRSTGMKLNLEYAKVWVDVLTTYDLPSSITVDLGNSTYVDVGVQLDWAPPCCSSCSVFGHATDKCRKTIVQEGAKFVGVSSGNSAGVVGEIGFNIGAKASSCPVIMDPIGDVVCGVDRQQENDVVSTIVVGSDDVGLCVRDEGVPSSNHGGVLSPNKFDALCDVVEEQIQVGTLRPCRVAATGVADLIPEI
ncbi:hypothetical protein V6N13_141231 [Hibiscus sabdariffa]